MIVGFLCVEVGCVEVGGGGVPTHIKNLKVLSMFDIQISEFG